MLNKLDLILIGDLLTQLKSCVADNNVDRIRPFLQENTAQVDEIIQKLDHGDNPQTTVDVSQIKKGTARVLVVDDVESMRGMLRITLRELGFRDIVLTNNAKSALSQMKQAVSDSRPFTFVITDWEMEEITGLQLLKKIRSDEELLKTPVYILTGIQKESAIKEAIKSGVNGYITKPISIEVMMKKFSKYLGKGK